MRHILSLLATCVLLLAACGDDDGPCDPVTGGGCDNGNVCESIDTGGAACFAPLIVRGHVFDLADDSGLAGARVVGLDVNGAAASSVAVSGQDGRYSLAVPVARHEDGTPVDGDITLRADANGYQTFPAGIRQALPIDLSAPVMEGGQLIVESSLTDVGLIALGGGAGSGVIFGTVEAPPEGGGVLVVAETSAGKGFSAVADRDGDYRIFNLAATDYTVSAYALGASYAPADVTVTAGSDTRADLALDARGLGSVAGSVNIVNAPGGSATSVLLVVESTFDETLARGDAPPGLRAGDVSGAFTIDNVPAGRYVVLAAFENDDLVRDPDTSIGGTQIQHIEVVPGMTVTTEGFKVTEALAIVGPGAELPEMVTATPTFLWVDDSSEDTYLVEVFDALGTLTWSMSIPGVSGEEPMLAYGGPALVSGMTYQFRVTSIKDAVPISRTEDLRGVFFLP